MEERDWIVYWLFDDTCVDRELHGYIGATNRFWRRMNQHRQKWPNFRMEVIFRGSKQEALALEGQLRPTPGIGWNTGIGGFANGGGLRGIPKPLTQRLKQHDAALKRYANPAEHLKTSRAVKKGLKGIDRSGPNNPNFGKHMSEEAKEKIRQRIAERNITGPNNPNFKHGRYC